ncbi:nucleoside deaminase [Nocardia sp. NPDC050712]|uniref:nucleoside deaminase n=1 Tax=Nocardia sp. NPDC050712 TaxID=3155518 RepID=UPI003403376F
MPDIGNYTAEDLHHLRRCVELAAEALADGDRPFGSLLVDGDGKRRAEDRNREISAGDPLRHPEIELARWALRNLSATERAETTMYTSGEHCPMCSGANALAGIGRIIFASSSAQLTNWLTEWGKAMPPFQALPITDVAPGIQTVGPIPELADQMADLHRKTPWPDA